MMTTRLIALLCCPALALAQVALDTPKGGWRSSSGEREQYTQQADYPAVSSTVQPGQSQMAQIRGRIAGAAKGKPATLVVNGVPMPLEVAEDGAFARPYAFGSGSNSVEVRSADGRQRARTQWVDSHAARTQARLRVVLSWDSAGTDLDLHVLTPTGGHAWYGKQVLADGSALDVDVTTGYGPEIFSSAAPPSGVYHIYVNYFGSGADTSALTVAQVAIITNENTPREKLQTFRIPMRTAGELTLVKSFVLPK